MSFTIYHNPRCRKSRAGLEFLQSKGITTEVRTYLRDSLTLDELKLLFSKLNLAPAEMIRTQEEAFKKELKGKSFTDDEWLRIIIENPKLLKRPIVVKENKAVWGDPVEELDVLF